MKENNKTYWKSFEELVENPSYLKTLEQEFTKGTSDNDFSLAITRRNFMKLLGASVALATTSCRRPVHKILPYVKQPENIKPGIAQYYASTFSLNNHSSGILVKTREGRPIKIEGNPDHPSSQGSSDTFAQASILELYDPDRKRNPTINGLSVSWQDWDQATVSTLKNAKNIRLLTESFTSPALRQTLQKFVQQFQNAKWVEYEPISQETARSAAKISFGNPQLPKIHLDKAKIILSINSDFLGNYESQVHLRNWAKGRKIRSTKDSMNRLYVVESFFSVTGSNSDHRLGVKPSELLSFSLQLAKILILDFHLSSDSQIKSLFQSVSTEKENSFKKEFLMALAEDLVKNQRQSIVLVGHEAPLELQIVGHFINSLIGTFSSEIIDRKTMIQSFDNGYKNIRPLLSELEAKKIDVLITIGGNPLYYLPEIKESFTHVPNIIRLSLYHDETALFSTYAAPLSHFLESWGDSQSEDGVVSLIQPTIHPLYKSRTAGEFLLSWLYHLRKDHSASPQDDNHITSLWLNEIKNYWKSKIYSKRDSLVSFESFWEGVLHDGVLIENIKEKRSFVFNTSALEKVLSKKQSFSNGLELKLHPSYTLLDGRFSNSGWLQELPDPVTKVTWDNVASMSSKTALKYGLKQGNIIELSIIDNSSATPQVASPQDDLRRVTLPVFLQPGLPEDVITTEVGYGRTAAGSVGTRVGSNTFIFGRNWQYTNVQLKKLYGKHKLAVTQGHHNMEGRPIVREATLKEYQKHPDFPKQSEHISLLTLYPQHEYKGHKWGMVIDLNSCVGCTGCIAACNAENNIPVVGKKQVYKGREIQWIRLDRYYEGNEENPAVLHQPMLCQHCENAPCEGVCPVAATTHSSEGLNQMTYNRCVGTRYCQNNCPYKVRRFNFLNYNLDIETPQELGKNPDVTIRARGVMEKCTFCVQRINDAKTLSTLIGQNRLSDGEVKTACQQSCPTEAIVFGDLNDSNSQVSKLSKLSHGYHVLEDLNTRSSITYLAKIRNPHPKLTAGHPEKKREDLEESREKAHT